jgi:hypothetical protein
MDSNFMTEWSKIRKNGIFKYILKKGILSVFLPVSIILIIIDIFHKYLTEKAYLFSTNFIIFIIIKFISICIIGGIFFGFIMWLIKENKYKKNSNKLD